MEMAVLAGALTSIRAVSDITKSLIGMNTTAEVNSKAVELTDVILSLQNDIAGAIASQAALVQENQELKNKLAQVENFRSEAVRYKLFEPWPGSLVYALKQSMSNGDPAHYLCTHCYESHKKSVLHGAPDGEKGWTYYRCPSCKTSIPTHYRGGVQATYPPEA